MTIDRSSRVALFALGMSCMAAGAAHAAPPAGPPGQAPNEVVVTNFPASQAVTINHEVDVNVSNSRRIQISIIGESSQTAGRSAASSSGPTAGAASRSCRPA
jgi:hypothetical protein